MSLVHLLATDRQRSVINEAVDVGRTFTAYGWSAIEGGPMSAFCGERRDALTGCYHLGNGYRQFNPGLMRFNSSDVHSPFDEGGINAYAYCKGDPLNHVDPSGGASVAFWSNLGGAILHLGSPVVLMASPAPQGLIARTATRVAVFGSSTRVAGAVLWFVGAPAAPLVTTVSTYVLAGAMFTRGVKTLWDNRAHLMLTVSKNLKDNFRVLTGRVAKKPKPNAKLKAPSQPPTIRSKSSSAHSIYTIEEDERRGGQTGSNTVELTEEVSAIRN